MDYSKLSDFEINKRVAISLDIDMHFYIPESEDSFQSGFLPTELGPIWQTSAGFVGEFTVSNGNMFNPCNNPSDAWPIIAESKICLAFDVFAEPQDGGGWVASPAYGWESERVRHDNPLRAAMMLFLKMQESANE